MKVRLQIFPAYKGVYDCLKKTWAREGVKGFYKGMFFPLVSFSMYNSLVFGSFQWFEEKICKLRYHDSHHKPALIDQILAAMSSGAVSVVLGSPVDLIKIRLQIQTGTKSSSVPKLTNIATYHQGMTTNIKCLESSAGRSTVVAPMNHYRGPMDCLFHIYRKNGIRGLYHGANVMVIRDIPGYAVYLVPYCVMREWFTKNDFESGWKGLFAAAVSGGLSGVLSWGIIHPLDTIKSRLISRKYNYLVKEYFKRCSKMDLTKVCKKLNGDAFKLLTDENTVLQQLLLPGTSYWLTDQLFIPVASSCKFLTDVDLSRNTQLTKESLFVLAQHCHLLVRISLNGCHWVDSVSFKLLVRNNPHLADVDVTSCWDLRDDSIVCCSNSCPGLVSLTLSNIYSITDVAVRSVATSCPNLSALAVRGCWRVTNDGIRVVGEYCKKLKRIQVTDCRDVTEASLARLRVRGVAVDIAAASEESLRRLGRTFEYALPYLNLQT